MCPIFLVESYDLVQMPRPEVMGVNPYVQKHRPAADTFFPGIGIKGPVRMPEQVPATVMGVRPYLVAIMGKE